MQRTCITTRRPFTITPAEANLCARMQMPLFVEHPEERLQRRLAWRNEWHFYKRTCDATGKHIVSLVHPDRERVVYDLAYWHSDLWNPQDYAMNYDPSRPFLEQFAELVKRVPMPATVLANSVNSQYSAWGNQNTDCYLCSCVSYDRNCYYSYFLTNATDVIDSSSCDSVENLHTCIFAQHCANLTFCMDVEHCGNAQFLLDCKNCHDCFWCVGLRNKQYCIRNVQYSKEEYEQRVKEELSAVNLTYRTFQEFYKWSLRFPRHFSGNNTVENCLGGRLTNCRNCINAFDGFEGDNCHNCFVFAKTEDCVDINYIGYQTQLVYNAIAGEEMINCGCTFYVIGGVNVWYSMFTIRGEDLLGCVGMKNARYCILNKQYTKEEYERLRAEIVASMEREGTWGQFLPRECSPFFYNDTRAQELFPLTATEAAAQGYPWSEHTFEMHYDGPSVEPATTIDEYATPEGAHHLLNGVLVCERSGLPYKVLPQELALYLRHGTPVPSLHPLERVKDRNGLMLPLKLYARSCMNPQRHDTGGACTNTFQTPYAPDRPEIIYCEECYLQLH